MSASTLRQARLVGGPADGRLVPVVILRSGMRAPDTTVCTCTPDGVWHWYDQTGDLTYGYVGPCEHDWHDDEDWCPDE